MNTGQECEREWSDLQELEFSREFATDFLSWQNNDVPPVYIEEISTVFPGFSYHDGKHLYCNSSCDTAGDHLKTAVSGVPPPGLLLKLSPGNTIQAVAKDSGFNFDHWPRWGIHDGKLIMKKVDVKISDLNEWRNSMPGGNPLAEKYESLLRNKTATETEI